MPLVNIPVMCGDVTSMVVGILYCTGHMVDGGNKDVEYFAEVMEDGVKSMILTKHVLMCFILMERVMYRKMEGDCVHYILGLTSSMLVNMVFLYCFTVWQSYLQLMLVYFSLYHDSF